MAGAVYQCNNKSIDQISCSLSHCSIYSPPIHAFGFANIIINNAIKAQLCLTALNYVGSFDNVPEAKATNYEP